MRSEYLLDHNKSIGNLSLSVAEKGGSQKKSQENFKCTTILEHSFEVLIDTIITALGLKYFLTRCYNNKSVEYLSLFITVWLKRVCRKKSQINLKRNRAPQLSLEVQIVAIIASLQLEYFLKRNVIAIRVWKNCLYLVQTCGPRKNPKKGTNKQRSFSSKLTHTNSSNNTISHNLATAFSLLKFIQR